MFYTEENIYKNIPAGIFIIIKCIVLSYETPKRMYIQSRYLRELIYYLTVSFNASYKWQPLRWDWHEYNLFYSWTSAGFVSNNIWVLSSLNICTNNISSIFFFSNRHNRKHITWTLLHQKNRHILPWINVIREKTRKKYQPWV